MKHYKHIDQQKQEEIFKVCPQCFDKNTPREKLAYALGATLYIPALFKDLYVCLTSGKYPQMTTVVICLEDSIGDHQVEEAFRNVMDVCKRISQDLEEGKYAHEDLPLIFIRARHKEQYEKLMEVREVAHICCGIVIPKFTSVDGKGYLDTLKDANQYYNSRLYLLPILETKEVIDWEMQREELFSLYYLLRKYKDEILNIRIGATDLSGIYGLRRGIDFTIYDIGVIRDCITKIINVFGKAEDQFVVSGPVWEYFNTDMRLLKPELRETPFKRYGAKGGAIRKDIVCSAVDGLIKEVILDKANGIVGKTIIHPSHITYVNSIQTVTEEEYEDAMQILKSQGGVIKSGKSNKMNEMKPHTYWAEKILMKAQIYGVIKENENYTALF